MWNTEGDCRLKLKKTNKDLQHAAPVSQRRKLKKSTSVSLQQQLDLPDQKDSLAVLKIKKELRRRTLIVRFAIAILVFLILMAVFFLVRAIVQNSASNQRPLSFPISTQDDAPLDIHVCGDWIVLTDSGDATFYSQDASRYTTLQHGCSRPVSVSAGDKLLTYDQGGVTVKLDDSGGNIRTVTADNTILFCAVEDGGAFAVVTTESRYRGSLSLYNRGGSEIYKWSSAENYIMAAAFVNSGELIVATVNVENADYVTQIYRLRTDRDQEEYLTSLNGVLPLSLTVKNGNIQLVAQQGVYTMDSQGTLLNTYSFSGSLCALGGLEEGHLLVATKDATDPNASHLAVLDSSGAATAQIDVDQAVLDVYSSDDGLVYLTPASIVLTDQNLTVQHQYDNDRSYTQAVRRGNLCYAIGTDTFQRLDPEE